MNYSDLPVYKHKDQILDALVNSQVIVVESPTGSGKTTQLPVILYEAGYAKRRAIGVTQPRRIAALSVSSFIAGQLNCKLGSIVGYKMRFQDMTEPLTKIKIMTDGILLQEMKLDPWLSRYDCLIVDEAHERSLNIDFILGLLKRILEERNEFKLIISSATINAGIFSDYFGQCPIVKIDAETYPVTLIYDPVINKIYNTSLSGRKDSTRKKSQSNRISEEIIINKIREITERILSERQNKKTIGDILIFLPGEKMIKDCISSLTYSPFGKDLHMLPLYGRLGKEEQERVFIPTPPGKTKIIVSTNIAETSVTINGISAVIDSGLSKLNHYNPKTYTSSLVEAPISKASANQRRGRAGRTMEGTCYRLYSRKDFESRQQFTTEEIYRTDLSEVVLRMADLGISSFEHFDFISAPGREGILAGIETLIMLDALNSDHSLTNTGKLMTEFPLPPRLSRIIAEAILKYPDIIKESIIATAFLSTQSPYVLPPGEEMDARKAHHSFRDSEGDFISWLKLYDAYIKSPIKSAFCEKNYLDEKAMSEIYNVVNQLEMIVSDLKIPLLGGGKHEDYLSAVSRGLVQFICTREGREQYRSLTADSIFIHPGSAMFKMTPDFMVAGEIIQTSRMYAMSVSPLSQKIVEKINPLILSGFGTRNKKSSIHGKNRTEKKEGSKRNRDFTNNIKIGGEVFEIKTLKNKKQVILPWEKLRSVISKIDPGAYRGLRGVIIIDGQYSLFKNEKLSLILHLAKFLDLDSSVRRKINFGESYYSDNINELSKMLPDLLKPSVWKAGKRTLGFIGLFTDGNGYYQIRCSRSFHTSLNESTSSLETLIDELTDNADMELKNAVNQSYRRLSELFNNNIF